MPITPESLAAAMDVVDIQNNSYQNGEYKKATVWYVINTRTAELDVNWPGELISEHDSAEAARLGRAKAIIDMVLTIPAVFLTK